MKILSKIYILILPAFLLFAVPLVSLAATLAITPSTGVYSAGTTFNTKVVVNTAGKPINAAEGTIKFNPQEVTVVSVSRNDSIFNLWVTEPTFSNSAGTINFSGGMPSGYTGSSGSIFNITFKTTSAGTARISLTNGSVLANDGMGTNVLTGMSGGTYTIQAPSTSPVPEVIEYVAPANTPAAPVIKSSTHSDSNAWYKSKTATLSWDLPTGVTAVRTLLDSQPTSIPTKVYDEPLRSVTLNDLVEGASYFHIQFKNSDGWGKVTHYRLGTDTEKPTSFTISLPEGADIANPAQTLSLLAEDKTSGVSRYQVKIDDTEPFEYLDEKNAKLITLPTLLPGYHTVIIEAFDKAGNSHISSYSFNILAFERPIFTDYPNEISEEVIPVVRGLTRPNSIVDVTIQKIGTEPTTYNLIADDKGIFTLIPEGTFTQGVYELSARAKDEFGAQSEVSEVIRIAVQQPGYVQVGSMLINLLSVVVPLFALLLLLVLTTWFLIIYFRRFKRRISIESSEVIAIVEREFSELHKSIEEKMIWLAGTKKTKKLTEAEEAAFLSIVTALKNSRAKIQKEAADVEQLVHKKVKKL